MKDVPGLVFPNIFNLSLIGAAAPSDESLRRLDLDGLSSITKLVSSKSFWSFWKSLNPANASPKAEFSAFIGA